MRGVSDILFWIGIGLISLVLVRLSLACVRSGLRWWRERRLGRLEAERLQVEIQRARWASKQLAEGPAWQGTRKFKVQKIVTESPDCRSFYLVPEDEKPLPAFRPGQYLTFQLNVPGETRPVTRCYSLSDRHHAEWYRCTIKYERGSNDRPPGKGSRYFHEHVQEGDRLNVKAPLGKFVLQDSDPQPVVLLAAGIGITPLFSMLAARLHQNTSEPVYLFYSVRDRRSHLFQQTLQDLATRYAHFKLIVNYTAPRDGDQQGIDFQFAGRLTTEKLREYLPSTNFQFYLCGPGGYVTAMSEMLTDMRVPESDIHTESFGPSSRQTSQPVVSSEPAEGATVPSGPVPNGTEIRFSRSGRSVSWESGSETLLDFAEKHGVAIDSACRSGSCGSCLTRICEGKVKYRTRPDVETESDECLPCVSEPDGDLVLEA